MPYNDKEKRKQYQREWYQKNREAHCANTNQWKKDNPEKAASYGKKRYELLKNDRSKMASVLLSKAQSNRKRPTRTLEFNLTVEYIQSLLEKQNYRCALSGIELDHKLGKNSLRVASIDRKNSNRGYVKGNVQIVLNCLNKAKGESTDKEFRQLLSEIRKHKVS